MSVIIELIRERNKCTFDIRELIEFIDGGFQQTLDRKEKGKFATHCRFNT